MQALMEEFAVSMNTVRRDVIELIQRGAVEKVYGGVCARKVQPALTPYEIRRKSNEEAKRKIGRLAAALVHDGDIIFIDSGTTTLHMIDCLRDRKDLTIITYNLEAITKTLHYENMTVLVLPGQLRRKTNSLTGPAAVQELQRYNIRTSFMAATGLSMHGATNSSPMEYEIKQCAIRSSEKSVLLLSSEKFGVTGLMTYAPVSAFSCIVTDRLPSEEYQDYIAGQRVRILCENE